MAERTFLDKKSCKELREKIRKTIEDAFLYIYAKGDLDYEQFNLIIELSNELNQKIGKDLLVDLYLEKYLTYLNLLTKDSLPNKATIIAHYTEFEKLE